MLYCRHCPLGTSLDMCVHRRERARRGFPQGALPWLHFVTPTLLSQDSPYGLSFIRFHSPPDKEEVEASPQVSSAHHLPEPSPYLFTPTCQQPLTVLTL